MRLLVASVAFASAVLLAAPSNADPGKLDPETCSGLSSAHMNLTMATTPQAARSAADILEKQNPPDQVKQAIEHFVTTVGVQGSDPTADQMDKTISDWRKQVCPS
jgi:hypothetical protein